MNITPQILLSFLAVGLLMCCVSRPYAPACEGSPNVPFLPIAKEIRVLKRDANAIESPVEWITFSSNGRLLAYASDTMGVKLFDVVKNKPVQLLAAQDMRHPLAFSVGGMFLATGGRANVVKIWNMETGLETLLLRHSGDVTSVAFSPDERTIVTSSTRLNVLAGMTPRGEARLYDITSGKVLHEIVAHDGPIYGAAFSPDGKILALVSGNRFRHYGAESGKLRLIDVASGKVTEQVEAHSNWATAVAFSPDGKSLATGSMDKTVKLWNVNPLKERVSLRGHIDGITSVVFSPDSKWLATSDLSEVKLWDATNGTEQKDFFPQHTACGAAAFTADFTLMATGDSDGGVRLWGIRSLSALEK